MCVTQWALVGRGAGRGKGAGSEPTQQEGEDVVSLGRGYPGFWLCSMLLLPLAPPHPAPKAGSRISKDIWAVPESATHAPIPMPPHQGPQPALLAVHMPTLDGR